MTKQAAPSKTPSPHRGANLSKQTVEADKSHGSLFAGMALDMSWRLAIAVLVPIIGGFELDKNFNTTPVLTIIGFVLAMAGMALVMWQTLQTANQLPVPKLTAAQKRAIKKGYEEDDD